MKTGLFALVAVSLLQLTASQPRGHRHQHPARQVVVTNIEYVTEYTVVTKTIYGDAGPPSTPSAPAVASVASSAASPPPPSNAAPSYAPPPSYAPAPAPTSSAVPSSSSPSAPSQSNTPSNPSSGSFPMGITYSPYKKDGTCKNQDQVNSDFEKINGYGVVRIYETSCDQVSTVLSAAKAKGMKLFAGINDLKQVSSDVQKIIDGVKGDWSSVDTIAIGNELVFFKKASADAVVSAMNSAKGQLNNAGYTGRVVTVDTVQGHLDNPQLCAESSYCAVNCHAFFDPHTDASTAGKFVISQAQSVAVQHPGKDTVITESGWPSAGGANANAVPSQANQQAAVASLKSHFSGSLILFSAFNEPYKQDNAGTHGVERFWGILGDSSM